jgi:hypothetical protein
MSAVPVMANEAGNQRPRRLFTAVRCRCDDPLQRSRRPQDAGIHAEAGILAPEPWTTRLQLRDSAGIAPDFPHFSLTPSDEALCCAFGCRRTLPWGSEVVKDARLASDYGRFVRSARVGHETLIDKFSETERTAFLRTLSQIGQ